MFFDDAETGVPADKGWNTGEYSTAQAWGGTRSFNIRRQSAPWYPTVLLPIHLDFPMELSFNYFDGGGSTWACRVDFLSQDDSVYFGFADNWNLTDQYLMYNATLGTPGPNTYGNGIPRSAGWHEVAVTLEDSSHGSLVVDGTTVFSGALDFPMVLPVKIFTWCDSRWPAHYIDNVMVETAGLSDTDLDGVPDGDDNCPFVANPEQSDTDLDGAGDACDEDDDNDGVLDMVDNCQFTSNFDQNDFDQDGYGDICDTDPDGDNIGGEPGEIDNCPMVPNPYQDDTDGDGQGDACDDDDDNDGICDAAVGSLLFDDFNDGQDEGWDRLGPLWSVVGGVYRSDNTGANRPVASVWAEGYAWTDYSIEADVTPLGSHSPSDAGIVFRFQDEYPNPSWCTCRIWNYAGIHLQLICEPGLYTSSLPLSSGIWGQESRLRASANGQDFTCELLGVEGASLQATVSAANTTGTVGFRAVHIPGLFDDIVVVGSTESTCEPGPDNCPTVVNPDQWDQDQDGIGDACDADIDGDGICEGQNPVPGTCTEANDNCPSTSNSDQEDTDHDGDGDVCDLDDDDDGVPDEDDNCQYKSNFDQEDIDEDGQGDVCDGDLDGDGIDNGVDNCPDEANVSQTDFDGDGYGDVCDEDDDGDGQSDVTDLCPGTDSGAIVYPDNGCSIDQLVPCDGPRGTNQGWKNHGQFVSSLAKWCKSFVRAGLLSESECDQIKSEGASSECGK